jgi:hypothetical protein
VIELIEDNKVIRVIKVTKVSLAILLVKLND